MAARAAMTFPGMMVAAAIVSLSAEVEAARGREWTETQGVAQCTPEASRGVRELLVVLLWAAASNQPPKDGVRKEMMS